MAQPPPVPWGSGFGLRSIRTKPWHPGAPQAGSSFPSVRSPLLMPLWFFIFSFFAFWPLTVIPSSFRNFCFVFLPLAVAGRQWGGERECERAAGKARGYLHFTCRIWSLRLAWM